MNLKLFVISWQDIWKKLSSVSVPICPDLLCWRQCEGERTLGRLALLWASHQPPGVKSDLHICCERQRNKSGGPISRKSKFQKTSGLGNKTGSVPHYVAFPHPVFVFVMCEFWLESWPNISRVYTLLRPGRQKHRNIFITYFVCPCLLLERAVQSCP